MTVTSPCNAADTISRNDGAQLASVCSCSQDPGYAMSDSLYPCVVQPIRGNLAPPPPSQPWLSQNCRAMCVYWSPQRLVGAAAGRLLAEFPQERAVRVQGSIGELGRWSQLGQHYDSSPPCLPSRDRGGLKIICGLGRFIEGRPDDLFWLLADMQRRWPLSTKLRPTQSERFRRKRQVQNLLGML